MLLSNLSIDIPIANYTSLAVGVKVLALTCTQKTQKLHREGAARIKQIAVCKKASHLAICKKKQLSTSKDQVSSNNFTEECDWSVHVNEMMSNIKNGIKETGVSYEQL